MENNQEAPTFIQMKSGECFICGNDTYTCWLEKDIEVLMDQETIENIKFFYKCNECGREKLKSYALLLGHSVN